MKISKKAIALLVTAILALSLLAGCDKESLAKYNEPLESSATIELKAPAGEPAEAACSYPI